MRKTILLTVLLLIFAISCTLGLAACDKPKQPDKPDNPNNQEPTVEIEEINMTDNLFLYIGEQEQLTFSVYPQNATYSKVSWSTADKTIADVDSKGLVTAISAGEITVTLTVDGKQATCYVVVEKRPDVSVNKIDLNKTSLYLTVGESEKLTASLTPSAPYNTVEWESGFEEGVVAVAQDGTVTAVADGETVVRAYSAGVYSDYCTVHVSSGTKGLQFSTRYGADSYAFVFDYDENVSSSDEVVIPSTYKGKPVKEISNDTFANCTSIKNIVIPDSVTVIGERAFQNCTGLTTVILPDNIESVGGAAFSGCTGLNTEKYGGAEYLGSKTNSHAILLKAESTTASYSIHSDTKIICAYAFSECNNITDISIPQGVKYVGKDAFRGTGVHSISVPESVKYIGFDVDPRMYELNEITVDENNSVYSSYDGVLYNKNKTEIILIPHAKEGTLTIAEGITEIKYIGATQIENLVLPDSVTKIDIRVWGPLMWLRTITVGENNANYVSRSGILYSKNGAKREIVHIPSQLEGDIELMNIESITASQFAGKGITSIIVPESVVIIEKGAFARCDQLQKMSLPFIGGKLDSHYYNYLDDADKSDAHFGYIFGATVNKISNSDALPDNEQYVPAHLKEVTITKQVGTQCYAFYGCKNIETIRFVNTDYETSYGSKIERGTFYECSKLETLILAHGIERIEAWAFTTCPVLTQLVLPSSCTSVQEEPSSQDLTVYYTGSKSNWNFTTSFADVTVYYSGEWEYVDGKPTAKK